MPDKIKTILLSVLLLGSLVLLWVAHTLSNQVALP
jgi:hypothetical protein